MPYISYKEASCICIRSSLLQSHLLHCMYTDRHRCTSAHTLSESMSTCVLSCPLQLALSVAYSAWLDRYWKSWVTCHLHVDSSAPTDKTWNNFFPHNVSHYYCEIYLNAKDKAKQLFDKQWSNDERLHKIMQLFGHWKADRNSAELSVFLISAQVSTSTWTIIKLFWAIIIIGKTKVAVARNKFHKMVGTG